jgi:hypothetical protein
VTGHGIVKLASGDHFEASYKLEAGWLVLEGRRRLHTNGQLLYSAPGKWAWPARSVDSIRGSEGQA